MVLGLLVCGNLLAQEWQSKIVYYDSDNKLVYERDEEGNRIPDFSYAGYKNGNDTIPDLPVIGTISPVSGDNTSNINNTIFSIALANPANSDGFRGTILMDPGLYEVYGTIKIQASGIILRGAGDGDDPLTNTIIYGRGNSPSNRTILVAGGGSDSRWRSEESGTRTNIVTDTILVGENSFEVEDASSYLVGDNIIIFHPSTDEWLSSIDYGGTRSDDPGAEPGVDVPWKPGSTDISYNRYITEIDGNVITVDVPLFETLIKDLSQSYIYRYTRSKLITNVGIEDLRIDIETANLSFDESHAYTAIEMTEIEDSWVRNCTMLHFYLSGVETGTATRVTVEDCDAFHPVSQITGGRRYNFSVYRASQQILFKNCNATLGRHSYVSNGVSTTSGIVFYNCTSDSAFAASEGHRQWSQALLYDNHRELSEPIGGYNPRRIGFYNRAYYGTSHGWPVVHSVIWNCDVNGGEIIAQKPPRGQNYAIGSFGQLVAGYGTSSFAEPAGFIEGANKPGLNPPSLYMAQLEERKSLLTGLNADPAELELIPEMFSVSDAYPNPFNPETKINVNLPEVSNLKIVIYNVTGEEIVTITNQEFGAGIFSFNWNGKNKFGQDVSSGMYFFSVSANQGMMTKKVIFLK